MEVETSDLEFIMRELDLIQDSQPFARSASLLNFNDFSFDFIQELIRVADSIDSKELQQAEAVLARLDYLLQSPTGTPLQRAAYFFKEALRSLLTGSIHHPARFSSWTELVQAIRSHSLFSAASPIPMFSHFTTDQVLIDSLGGSRPFVHVVDFDIGFGSHYASFMRSLRDRSASCKSPSPILRITAVVPDNSTKETKLIGENLARLAVDFKIRFQIDFVLFRNFQLMSFKAIKFLEREITAVLLSPAIFRRLYTPENVNIFVTDLRRSSPALVIMVDGEEWERSETSSFSSNVLHALEFYALLIESLDTHGGAQLVGRIEKDLFGSRIMAAVEACWRRVGVTWREAFSASGMKPMELSHVAQLVGECVANASRLQPHGFSVAKRQVELVLCCLDRPLVAMSAWKC